MANYDDYRDRDRNDFYPDWDDESFGQQRNYGNRRSYYDDGYGRNYGRNDQYRDRDDNYRNRSYNDDYGRGNTDRYLSDNDNSNSRGAYGNATGVNRGSGNYLARNENNNDRNRRSRPYPGSDYGYERTRYRDDRDWWDKSIDELYSWFGDEQAERRRRMDRLKAGQHRGKGPKGYKRSDSRIEEEVNDRLAEDSHIDASDIEVTVKDGEVTLTGTVDSKFAKRHAEDIVEYVLGVKHVENRLRVRSASDNSSDFGAPGASQNAGI